MPKSFAPVARFERDDRKSRVSGAAFGGVFGRKGCECFVDASRGLKPTHAVVEKGENRERRALAGREFGCVAHLNLPP